MGGFGSGGHNIKAGRRTTAQMLMLDIHMLLREGALQRDGSGSFSWSRDGETCATIGLSICDGLLTLNYLSDGMSCEDRVYLDWMSCHLGGQRPFFRCPHCARRATKLYGPRFRCLSCHDLVYPCQRDSAADRPMRKANRLRMKLGGKPGMANPIAEKPKWMRWPTYNQIVAEISKAEALTFDFSLRLLERLDRQLVKKGFWT
jgi:hypothetical protein